MQIHYFLTLLLAPISAIEYVLFSKATPADRRQYLKLDYQSVTSVVIVGEFDQMYINILRFINPYIKLQILVNDCLDTSMMVTVDKREINKDYLEERAKYWTRFVITRDIDGINLDFEKDVYCQDSNNQPTPLVKQALTYFVQFLSENLKSYNEKFIITYDVPSSDPSIRCADWTQISKHVDYLYVMGYDNLDNSNLAQCGDKLPDLIQGMDAYLSKYNISKRKLVQLVPWYNPKFKCLGPSENSNFTLPKTVDDPCFTEYWSAKNGQVGLGICQLHSHLTEAADFQNHFPAPENENKCLKFLYYEKFSDTTYKIYFDTVETLKIKMQQIAVKWELAGIGFWWSFSQDNTDSTCYDKFLQNYWALMQETVNVMKYGPGKRESGTKLDFSADLESKFREEKSEIFDKL